MKSSSKIATVLLSTAMTVAGFAGMAGTAHAATGTTTTTFTLTAGVLAVTPPAAAVLGNASAGSATMVGALGVVTVADLRAAANNAWTNSVSSTSFTTGVTPTSDMTVAASQVAYSSGSATSVLPAGSGSFTPGSAASLASPSAAGVHTAGVGVSTTIWDPTITLTLLTSQVAGLYTGTITHSIA